MCKCGKELDKKFKYFIDGKEVCWDCYKKHINKARSIDKTK